jgi:hypothetical protein
VHEITRHNLLVFYRFVLWNGPGYDRFALFHSLHPRWMPDLCPSVGLHVSQRKLQVNAYLTISEQEAFEAYACKFYLDAAGLLALLLARETRVGRLSELIQMDKAPPANRNTKVTARLIAEVHAELTTLANHHSVSLSRVGAVLVRAELRDNWLEKACLTRFES